MVTILSVRSMVVTVLMVAMIMVMHVLVATLPISLVLPAMAALALRAEQPRELCTPRKKRPHAQSLSRAQRCSMKCCDVNIYLNAPLYSASSTNTPRTRSRLSRRSRPSRGKSPAIFPLVPKSLFFAYVRPHSSLISPGAFVWQGCGQGVAPTGGTRRQGSREGGGGQTGLPIGWLRYVDAQSGRRYFYHLHTRRTTWAIPRGAQDGRDGGRDVEVAAIGDTRVRRDAKAIWDEAEVPQESAAIARRILSEVSDSERKSDGEVSEEEVADESSSWSAAGMGFKLSLAKLKREAIDDDRPNAFHVKHPPHLISPKPPSTSTPHCHPPNTT